jgi:hypothetical protein
MEKRCVGIAESSSSNRNDFASLLSQFSYSESQASNLVSQSSQTDPVRRGQKRKFETSNSDPQRNLSIFQSFSVVEHHHSQDSSLCIHCSKINFDKIFDVGMNDEVYGRAKTVCSLHHVTSSSQCCLCQLFETMKQGKPGKKPRLCDLVALSAVKTFQVDRNSTQDSVILGVHPSKFWDRPSRNGGQSRWILQSLNEPSRISGRSISEKIDWKMVKSWKIFCDNHHSKFCSKNEGPLVPGLKVLDCQTRRIINLPTLRDEYVTLSYVWGTNQETIKFGHALPITSPQLINDSVEVVKNLGYRYLWIDRYCIPQNDKQERHRLIQSMGNIYRNSAMTIIATACENPTYGLPGVGNTPRHPQPSVKVGSHLLVSSLDITQEVDNSTWSSRGWTYQEALLSRRRLVFTHTQIYFQCAVMHCLEGIYVPLESLHTRDLQRYRHDVRIPRAFPSRGIGLLPSDIEERISEYSRRSLTLESDSLRAFQGILQSFSNMKQPVKHFQGIPIFPKEYLKFLSTSSRNERLGIDLLLIGLFWSIDGPADRRRTLPSWTWAGWKLGGTSTWKIHSGCHKSGKFLVEGRKVPVQVAVEFDDGVVLSWEDYESRKYEEWAPFYLRIKGWIFELELFKKSRGWEVKRPRACLVAKSWKVRLESITTMQYTPEQARNCSFTALLTRTVSLDTARGQRRL